jgi:hypothetical protein
MKFFTITDGCILFDHKKTEEILGELEVEAVDEKLRRYNLNWLRHVIRMNSSRMRKML